MIFSRRGDEGFDDHPLATRDVRAKGFLPEGQKNPEGWDDFRSLLFNFPRNEPASQGMPCSWYEHLIRSMDKADTTAREEGWRAETIPRQKALRLPGWPPRRRRESMGAGGEARGDGARGRAMGVPV